MSASSSRRPLRRHVSGAQTCSFFIADEPRRHDLIDLGAYAPCGACAHYTHDRVLQILTLSLCAKSLRGPRRSSSRMVTRILTVTQTPPPPTPFLHHTTRRRLSVAFFSIHPDNALNGQQRWDATDNNKKRSECVHKSRRFRVRINGLAILWHHRQRRTATLICRLALAASPGPGLYTPLAVGGVFSRARVDGWVGFVRAGG